MNKKKLGYGESNPGLMRPRLRSESHRCYRYTIPDESDVVSDVVGDKMGSLRYVSTVLSLWSVEWLWIREGCALVDISKRGATSGSPGNKRLCN